MVVRAALLIVALSLSPAVAACVAPPPGAAGVIRLSPPRSAVVVGAGRLPFHDAPHPACRQPGVFVVPGDDLVAYAETRGWTSVMFLPATGGGVTGWVRSSRLKLGGTMGPG